MEETGPFSEDEMLAHMRGEAAPELSQRIEAAAANDPALRAEIATMQGIKQALSDEDTGNPPGEFAWRKLETAIREETTSAQQSRSKETATWWRAAAVFLGLAVLGQGVYIAVNQPRHEEVGFRTASQATEQHVLAIRFASGTQVDAMTALLHGANGRMIGGPGASGLYRVAFVSDDSRQAARAVFEGSDIVTLVAEE